MRSGVTEILYKCRVKYILIVITYITIEGYERDMCNKSKKCLVLKTQKSGHRTVITQA